MQGILESISAALTMTSSQNDDTYIGKDGLPYCSKCHTLRVTQDIIQGFGKRMPVWCDCMREKERKEKEREEHNKKAQELDRLRSASLLGERYKNATFDTTDKAVSEDFLKAYSRCKGYCDIAEEALKKGYGIYIYGNSGTGKTHLTACMCNELISKSQQCLFTNFFEISRLIRSTFNKNIEAEVVIKRICDIDFLFIDDLGTEVLRKNGEDNWLQEQVFDIINKRYNNRKPTIFSSNHSLNELITERGMMEKTVDRIMEMSTAIIKLNGTSYRAKNRKALF